MVERRTDFARKSACVRRCHYALSFAREEWLAEPVFENRNVPADGAVREVQFARRSRIAARARGNFELIKYRPRNPAWYVGYPNIPMR